MKKIQEFYKGSKVESALNSTYEACEHKVRAQGRWARLKLKKQADKVEGLLEVPQTHIRKLTEDLQHDVSALKRLYENQKRELNRLGRNLRKSKDRFLEKSKIFSNFSPAEATAAKSNEKVVKDNEVA